MNKLKLYCFKSAVAFFFLFFLHGTSIGNGQQGISYNVLRIYEVRLNGILNYKQMLVCVSCIYAVRRSTVNYGRIICRKERAESCFWIRITRAYPNNTSGNKAVE
jgi:hypothetical protein